MASTISCLPHPVLNSSPGASFLSATTVLIRVCCTGAGSARRGIGESVSFHSPANGPGAVSDSSGLGTAAGGGPTMSSALTTGSRPGAHSLQSSWPSNSCALQAPTLVFSGAAHFETGLCCSFSAACSFWNARRGACIIEASFDIYVLQRLSDPTFMCIDLYREPHACRPKHNCGSN